MIRIEGKISSTDKAGNSLGEAKIIADTIVVVSADELDQYQSTGKKMKQLRARVKPILEPTKENDALTVDTIKIQPKIQNKQLIKTLYVRVLDPSDHDSLQRLKSLLNDYKGSGEIILVLGDTKTSAMRLPFGIDPKPELCDAIKDIYGSQHVVLK